MKVVTLEDFWKMKPLSGIRRYRVGARLRQFYELQDSNPFQCPECKISPFQTAVISEIRLYSLGQQFQFLTEENAFELTGYDVVLKCSRCGTLVDSNMRWVSSVFTVVAPGYIPEVEGVDACPYSD